MKKIILFSLFFISILSSCKKEKQLEEVQLPDANEIEEIVYNNPADVKTKKGPFKMLGLKYQYNDLEPYIDAQTVELHYAKHLLSFANNLNIAIENTEFSNKSIEEILSTLDINNLLLRHNAGGYYNHNLYFEILSPKKNTKPSALFDEAIQKEFSSLNAFKKEISNKALSIVVSGWVWLLLDQNGNLKISETINQDNPLMPNATIKGTPILAIDLWEHAYYLQYKNNKKDYIEAIFNLINWEIVSENYEKAIQNNSF